jgi:hypothetical protein
MQTVLIYHTCENFFANMQSAFAATPVKLVHCNNYNKCALLDSVAIHLPHYVMIEKRVVLDVMELIIEKAKLIVPSSKFILLGANASQCDELSSFFANSEYSILNEETIHKELPKLFQASSSFYLESLIKDKAIFQLWNSLTTTEKRIVDVVCKNQIMHVKDVIYFTKVASYSTLRTHLKNIYKKLNIHNFKNLSALFLNTPIATTN